MYISNAQIQKVMDVHLNKVYGPRGTTQAGGVSKSDELVLSSKAADMQSVKSALAQIPATRPEVVSSIKAAVDSGDYQIASDGLAASIMESIGQSKAAV
jgi:flagellar biosynthesis anti-sigma factor FlgM